MNRLVRLAAFIVAAGAVFTSLTASLPAAAQGEPTPLVVGQTLVATLREGDRLNGQEWTIEERINHVHDYIAQHLGGQTAKVTTKKWGERTHLYVNGDFVLAVTPADAKATGYKTTPQLARIWQANLSRALGQAGARSTGR